VTRSGARRGGLLRWAITGKLPVIEYVTVPDTAPLLSQAQLAGSGTARRPAWRSALRRRRIRGRARNCWRCPGRLVRLSSARSAGR
jgi:hypothetical protein